MNQDNSKKYKPVILPAIVYFTPLTLLIGMMIAAIRGYVFVLLQGYSASYGFNAIIDFALNHFITGVIPAALIAQVIMWKKYIKNYRKIKTTSIVVIILLIILVIASGSIGNKRFKAKEEYVMQTLISKYGINSITSIELHSVNHGTLTYRVETPVLDENDYYEVNLSAYSDEISDNLTEKFIEYHIFYIMDFEEYLKDEQIIESNTHPEITIISINFDDYKFNHSYESLYEKTEYSIN